MTPTIEGLGATPLSGVGTARWLTPTVPDFDRTSDDPECERERFEDARDRARDAIEDERARVADRVGEDEAAILDAHRQFLDDPQIESSVEDGIGDGLSAEAAVETAFEAPIEQYEATGGRVAERADDLRDVRDRLIRTLTGTASLDLSDVPADTILLAERLAPSDAAKLDPDRIAGLATIVGGQTAHAVIVARAIGLPAVVGLGDALRDVEDGTPLVVDGEAGVVIVDPDEDARTAAGGQREVDVIDETVETADGTSIEVAANLGRPVELDGARNHGADGIGLYRTEFLYLNRPSPPDEDDQFDAYREALTMFPGERVVVRTADVGGDKPIPYLDAPEESNPFLGERGIRRSLGPDADLFESQLRALLLAVGWAEQTNEPTGDLAVMFPMIADVVELDAALERVAGIADDLDDEGVDHATPELGVMIETPAAARLARELAERVDFLSIGTNDLTQYVMAADRENERVASLHDPLHPPVLRAIRDTVEGGHAGDAWVGMCGEMAGKVALTELLVGLGLDEFSASAVSIPGVKARIREVDRTAARSLADRATAAETRGAVRVVLGLDE